MDLLNNDNLSNTLAFKNFNILSTNVMLNLLKIFSFIKTNKIDIR